MNHDALSRLNGLKESYKFSTEFVRLQTRTVVIGSACSGLDQRIRHSRRRRSRLRLSAIFGFQQKNRPPTGMDLRSSIEQPELRRFARLRANRRNKTIAASSNGSDRCWVSNASIQRRSRSAELSSQRKSGSTNQSRQTARPTEGDSSNLSNLGPRVI